MVAAAKEAKKRKPRRELACSPERQGGVACEFQIGGEVLLGQSACMPLTQKLQYTDMNVRGPSQEPLTAYKARCRRLCCLRWSRDLVSRRCTVCPSILVAAVLTIRRPCERSLLPHAMCYQAPSTIRVQSQVCSTVTHIETDDTRTRARALSKSAACLQHVTLRHKRVRPAS